MKKIFSIMLFALAMTLAGCGKSDPDNGGEVGPNEKVDDPAGTVELTMRNASNGETWLDNIYIGKDDNFRIRNGSIASIGAVRGLGNVSNIPVAGWSDKVAVTPGNGYVAYDGYSDTYYRIYVADYVVSTAGGVIGANVKYQKPFKGLDQTLEPDLSAVVLDPAQEETAQQIVFKNKSIIPFTVESSEEWCRVRKASTRDQSFLYDAVVISTDQRYNAEARSAKVTLTNLYGKSTVIDVTLPGRGTFIETGISELNFDYSDRDQWQDVGVFTNIEPADIKVEADVDWLSGTIQEGYYKPARTVRSIEGRGTRATLDNPVNRNLRVKCTGYMGSGERKGILTLTYQQTKVSIQVTQQGSSFSISETSVELGGNENLSKQIYYNNAGLNYSNFTVDYDGDSADWLSVSFDWNNIILQAQANPSEKEREATVKILYNNGDTKYELGKLAVRQLGAKYEDQKVYFESTASNYTLVFPIAKDKKITSTADWCTATPSGGNLVIRATSTTENRSAVISIEGVSAKIYVSQSKYKVGDDYSEDGVEGKIYLMDEGVGHIYKPLAKAAWSTEYVVLAETESMTDGKANMAGVKNVPGWKELYPAFAMVDELNKDGVTGWYMPALAQLKAMRNVSLTEGHYYWSSTGYGYSQAWACVYGYYGAFDQNGYYLTKSDQRSVVAIHDFSYDFNR